MTMPELMNCPHSGDGWCLQCVRELSEGSNRRISELEQQLKNWKWKCANAEQAIATIDAATAHYRTEESCAKAAGYRDEESNA